MAQKFKMSLDAFEAEHERIGKHLAAARDSQTESGSYRLKLAAIRAAHSRMGDMIVDAYASISEPTASDTMDPPGASAKPRGAESGPRGMDSAIPDLHRLAPGVGSVLGENMDRLFRNR